MKEHQHKKHRRDLDDPPQKIPRREPQLSPESGDEQEQQTTKRRHRHHHRHHHSSEKRISSRGQDERERERDHRKRRETSHEEGRRKTFDQVKVKEEPGGDNDYDVKERTEPSSSRWDDEEDRSHVRDRGHERRRAFSDGRGGRGGSRGGRGGSRGGRGGGRGGRGGGREEEDTSNMEWGKKTDNGDKNVVPPAERDKPNFGLSGKLTEDTNTYKGIVIKYSEPPEARVPKRRWRLYPFKGDEALKVLHIHRASAFLMGRERQVVDIALDHPSCSKQHAALQFRYVHYTRDDGSTGKRIRPYIIDLDSANGTFVNNNKIEPRKYVELLERDVLKFGYSSREYVLLHEHSKDDDADDM